MAIKIDLTPLLPLDPLTEPSSISQNWKSWKVGLKTYVLGHSEYNRGHAEKRTITLTGWTSHTRNLWLIHGDWRELCNGDDKARWILLNEEECRLSIPIGCPESRWNSQLVCYPIEKTSSSLRIFRPRERVKVRHHPELPLKTSVKVCPLRRSPHTE